MNPELEVHPLILEIRRIVLRIGLVSHAGAAQLGRSSKGTDDDIGGRRPSGGIEKHDEYCRGCKDCDGTFALKSAEHFQRKLQRCNTAFQLQRLRDEAQAAWEAWSHTPAPKPADLDPIRDRGTFYWKCAIADDDRPLETVKTFYMVSRATVYRYRAKYRALRKLPSASGL